MSAVVDKEEEDTEEEKEDRNNPEKNATAGPHTQQFRMKATHHESSVHSNNKKHNEQKSIWMLLDSKIRHMTGRDNK